MFQHLAVQFRWVWIGRVFLGPNCIQQPADHRLVSVFQPVICRCAERDTAIVLLRQVSFYLIDFIHHLASLLFTCRDAGQAKQLVAVEIPVSNEKTKLEHPPCWLSWISTSRTENPSSFRARIRSWMR